MSMNQVRTTVSLPDDTLRISCSWLFKIKKTLGELIDGLVRNRNFLADKARLKSK